MTFFAKVGGESEEFVNPEPNNDHGTSTVIFDLVEAELSRIKDKKATNYEDYRSWISRVFAEFICGPLTDIIKCMLKQCRHPLVWKRWRLFQFLR